MLLVLSFKFKVEFNQICCGLACGINKGCPFLTFSPEKTRQIKAERPYRTLRPEDLELIWQLLRPTRKTQQKAAAPVRRLKLYDLASLAWGLSKKTSFICRWVMMIRFIFVKRCILRNPIRFSLDVGTRLTIPGYTHVQLKSGH